MNMSFFTWFVGYIRIPNWLVIILLLGFCFGMTGLAEAIKASREKKHGN